MTNQQRYESWVDQWSKDLYRTAYRLCGRADQAEDLVQETFYHAWRSMKSLRDLNKARAWLFQILRHRYAHLVRTEVRRPRLTGGLTLVEGVETDGDGPLDRMARSQWLQLGLDELDERYRLPLIMVLMEGLTCQEAADELKVPLGTILSRIYRGRRALQTHLERLSGEQNETAGSVAKTTLKAESQNKNGRALGGTA